MGLFNCSTNLVSNRTVNAQVEGALTALDGDCQNVLFKVTVPPQVLIESFFFNTWNVTLNLIGYYFCQIFLDTYWCNRLFPGCTNHLAGHRITNKCFPVHRFRRRRLVTYRRRRYQVDCHSWGCKKWEFGWQNWRRASKCLPEWIDCWRCPCWSNWHPNHRGQNGLRAGWPLHHYFLF
jgi:hypothetical protein